MNEIILKSDRQTLTERKRRKKIRENFTRLSEKEKKREALEPIPDSGRKRGEEKKICMFCHGSFNKNTLLNMHKLNGI